MTRRLDRSGHRLDVDERFAHLDDTRWWPFYTPHWASREASAARLETGVDGLRLRIDADTEPWCPEFDGDIRVSHLQTGQFSGTLGSEVGQHVFRDGLVVREEQPELDLLTVRHGIIEARAKAIAHPDAITENRAAGKWTRRIDGDYADTLSALSIEHRELIDQR